MGFTLKFKEILTTDMLSFYVIVAWLHAFFGKKFQTRAFGLY